MEIVLIKDVYIRASKTVGVVVPFLFPKVIRWPRIFGPSFSRSRRRHNVNE